MNVHREVEINWLLELTDDEMRTLKWALREAEAIAEATGRMSAEREAARRVTPLIEALSAFKIET